MASGLHDELGLGGGQLQLDEDGARRLEVVAHASNKLAVVVRILEEQSCRVCILNRVYTSAVKRSRLKQLRGTHQEVEVFTRPLEDGSDEVPVPRVGVDGLVDFRKLHV